MSKHTPGPWRVILDDTGGPFSGRPSVVSSDEIDCGIVHGDGFTQTHWRSARGDREIHANARLIAAAPAMADALLELDAMFRRISPDDPDGLHPATHPAWRRAKVVLAAAGLASEIKET